MTVVDCIEPIVPFCILICDDEPFNVSGLRVILQVLTAKIPNFDMKSHIDTALNGIQAIEKVKQCYQKGHCYKVILMDCNMPQLDGYEATELIRKFISDNGFVQPMIVALTGHSEHHYIKRAFDAGMNKFIKKPA